MLLQQRVIIRMQSQNGGKLGELMIGSCLNSSQIYSNDHIKSFQFGPAEFTNIFQTSVPGNLIPIEFLYNCSELRYPRLMLLEETDYQILFKSEYDIDVLNGDAVLPELAKGVSTHNVLFDKWLLDENEKTFRGILNFCSYVGKSYLDVVIDGQQSIKIPFEVRSKKIGYIDQYPAMIGDISEICSGLMLDKDSPLYQELQFSGEHRLTYYEDYMFLEYIFSPEHLPLAYEIIRKNPCRRLETEEEEIPSALASNIGYSDLIEIVTGSDEFVAVQPELARQFSQFNGLFPANISQPSQRDDVDVPENQLVKDLLLSLDGMVNTLLESSSAIEDGYAKERLSEFNDTIQSFLSDEWLSDVNHLQFIPTNSQVLQKKEGYMELFQYHLNLNLSFKFRWREFEDSIKGYNQKLSLLYEYWCFLELVKVLSRLSGTQTKYDDLFQLDADGWSVRLKRGAKSIKDFFVNVGEQKIRVSLMYNRSFSRRTNDGFNSYTFAFRPDYTLCIDTGLNAFLIHFDAKYRSDKEERTTDDPNEGQQEVVRTYWEDDVCKMHTYKDAILKTEGAYIFYPGSGDADIFRVDASKEIPSVGAFSLTPGRSDNECNRLELFIKSILNKVIS